MNKPAFHCKRMPVAKPRWAQRLARVQHGVYSALCGGVLGWGLLFSPAIAQGVLSKSLSSADAFHDPLAEPLASGRPIRIGVQRGAVPFAFESPNEKNTFRGYSVDVCLRILNLLFDEQRKPFDAKRDVQFVPVTSKTRMVQLLAGQIDIECGSTSNTPERRSMGVGFSSTVFVSDVAVLMSPQAAAQARTLAGWVNDVRKQRRVVVTTAGSTSVRHLRELGGQGAQRLHVVLGNNHDDSLAKLIAGQADAFVMDRGLLATWLAADKRLAGGQFVLSDWSIVPGTLECYGILSRMGNPKLREGIERALTQLRESGELAAMYGQWFEQPLSRRNRVLDLPPNRALNLPISAHLSRVFITPGYEACP
jgi:glutamate/aspartate transport system substrate-binding protein